MSDKADSRLALRLDPRTKIILLVVFGICACFCRDAAWGSVLFALALLFSCITGEARLAVKFLVGYVAVLAFVTLAVTVNPEIGTRIALIFQSFRAAFPPFLMAAILIMTTKTGDLVAALYAFRVPRLLVIPLAVGIRFFPTLVEEFRCVVDAARLQGVSFSPAGVVRHPSTICESLIVPTVLRSAKIAEELAAAAVTRGIEKPGERTSFNELALSRADIALLLCFSAACVAVSVACSIAKGGWA